MVGERGQSSRGQHHLAGSAEGNSEISLSKEGLAGAQLSDQDISE